MTLAECTNRAKPLLNKEEEEHTTVNKAKHWTLEKKMFIKKRNFTTQERKLLVEILKSYKDIVNNKRTDAINAELKKKTWVKIAQKYNSSDLISESARPEQLRRLWQNMKTRQRGYLSKECHCRLANACKEVYVVPDSDVTKNLMVEIEYSEDSDEKEHSFEELLMTESGAETGSTEERMPTAQSPTQPDAKSSHRKSSESQTSKFQSSDSPPAHRQPSHSPPENRQSLHSQPENRQSLHSQPENRQSLHSQPENRQSLHSQPENRQSLHSQPVNRQSLDSQLQYPQSTYNTSQPLQKSEINYFNQMEEKVRINIMQKEYIDRKRRADELHLFDLKKKELEIEILQMQLREVQSKPKK